MPITSGHQRMPNILRRKRKHPENNSCTVFSCVSCPKRYNNKDDLLMHIYKAHAIFADLTCGICNQQCTDSTSLGWHIEKHIDSYNCEEPCHYDPNQYKSSSPNDSSISKTTNGILPESLNSAQNSIHDPLNSESLEMSLPKSAADISFQSSDCPLGINQSPIVIQPEYTMPSAEQISGLQEPVEKIQPLFQVNLPYIQNTLLEENQAKMNDPPKILEPRTYGRQPPSIQETSHTPYDCYNKENLVDPKISKNPVLKNPVTNRIQTDNSLVDIIGKFTCGVQVESNSNVKCFTCIKCPQSFEHERDFQRHWASHRDWMVTCNFCNTLFKTKRQLDVHFAQEHKIGTLQCSSCNGLFGSQEGLTHHILDRHAFSKQLSSQTPSMQLQRSMQIAPTENPHGHPIHTQTTDWMAGQNYIYNPNGKKFQCNLCEASYSHKRSLTAHVTSAHSQRRHRCNLCCASYTRKHHLEQHYTSKHEGKRFQCHLCELSYTARRNLTAHIKAKHVG